MFLFDEDYSSQVRDEVLEIISDSNDEITRQDAELKAQSLIETYLNNRYDLRKIFLDVLAWNNSATYNADNLIHHEGKTYYALQASTGATPGSAPEHWQLGDKRNKHIISITIDIVLYKLYTSNNTRAIPSHVERNYDDALSWLEKVSAGKIGPNLPLLPKDTGNPVKAGSEPKQSHYW